MQKPVIILLPLCISVSLIQGMPIYGLCMTQVPGCNVTSANSAEWRIRAYLYLSRLSSKGRLILSSGRNFSLGASIMNRSSAACFLMAPLGCVCSTVLYTLMHSASLPHACQHSSNLHLLMYIKVHTCDYSLLSIKCNSRLRQYLVCQRLPQLNFPP